MTSFLLLRSVSLVASAGLVDTLNGAGPFVVLAPTNAAFARLPAALVNQVTADPALLTKVLTYHVVAGQLPMRGVQDRQLFTTVAGENITTYFTGDRLLRAINYAEVQSFEPVRCQNGMIFLLDNVLIPSGLGPMLPTPAPTTAPVTMNIVQVLQLDPRFNTLGNFFLHFHEFFRCCFV